MLQKVTNKLASESNVGGGNTSFSRLDKDLNPMIQRSQTNELPASHNISIPHKMIIKLKERKLN